MSWFSQILSAVAHCHAHGAVHGQLRPENVLMRDGRPQLIGFYCCCRPEAAGEPTEGGGVGEQAAAEAELVGLRAYQTFDAPELEGRTEAWSTELKACDMWGLGILLLLLLSGSPHLSPAVVAAQAAMFDSLSRDRATQTSGRGQRGRAAGVAEAAKRGTYTSLSACASHGPSAGPRLTHTTTADGSPRLEPLGLTGSISQSNLSISTPRDGVGGSAEGGSAAEGGSCAAGGSVAGSGLASAREDGSASDSRSCQSNHSGHSSHSSVSSRDGVSASKPLPRQEEATHDVRVATTTADAATTTQMADGPGVPGVPASGSPASPGGASLAGSSQPRSTSGMSSSGDTPAEGPPNAFTHEGMAALNVSCKESGPWRPEARLVSAGDTAKAQKAAGGSSLDGSTGNSVSSSGTQMSCGLPSSIGKTSRASSQPGLQLANVGKHTCIQPDSTAAAAAATNTSAAATAAGATAASTANSHGPAHRPGPNELSPEMAHAIAWLLVPDASKRPTARQLADHLNELLHLGRLALPAGTPPGSKLIEVPAAWLVVCE